MQTEACEESSHLNTKYPMLGTVFSTKGHLPDPLTPDSPQRQELGLRAGRGLCSKSQRIY